MKPLPAAFDGLAPDYDTRFTETELGRRHRHAVWRRLDVHFAAGMRVLDLGCGTGEDACHLASRGVQVVAVDNSAAMIAKASQKLAVRGLTDLVAARHLDVSDLTSELGQFDGALSNFGAVNCLPLPQLHRVLSATVKPGAAVVLVVMGPRAVWELLWFAAHGRPRQALRRFPSRGVDWRGLRVHYPSAGRLAAALAPEFVVRRTAGVGTLLPPTFAAAWAERHTRWIDCLYRLERRWETSSPIAALADHYIAEFERVVPS